VLPAEAKRETKEGLRAFADYWFETLNYGVHTGDYKKFWEITNPECETCKNLAEGVPETYKAGGWILGSDTSIAKYSDKFESDVNDTYGPRMTLKQLQGTEFKANGSVAENFPASASDELYVMYSRFKDGAWRVADFGTLGGGK
jgi:Family of unknown function (DUF6318)